ncbi:MAG: tetratricopeptide repeat protein [Methylococcales bacterium]
MEIYETEEEQLEALKRWWKENGQATIVGLLVGIGFILGWDYWQNYKKDRLAEASGIYEQLLKADEAGNKESAAKLAEHIQEQYKDTEYAIYSELFEANLKIQQNDLAAAKQILKDLAAKADKNLSNIAKIRLVRLMLATGEYEQGLQLVNEASAQATSSFSGNYDELVGDLYVALDRLDEARTSYESAIRNNHQSPLLQFKLDDLTAPEKAEVKK